MSSQVELNKAAFNSRIKRIYDCWSNAQKSEEFNTIVDVDALLLIAGASAAEDEPIRKGTCLQTWILGYEFPETIILFERQRLSVLCSANKGKILSQISNSDPSIPVDIFAQAKGKDPANDALPQFFERYISHKRVGTLTKETHTGKVVDEWNKKVAAAAEKPSLVDMSIAISGIMAPKDQDELEATRTAGILTSTLLKHFVLPKLESILDRETKISHELFATQIEVRLGAGEGENAKGPDMKVWNQNKSLANVDWLFAEFCYQPIVISRSTKSGYDIRFTAESSTDNISHKGVLLVSLGMKYKTYCANISRTFIVDPTPEQESQYQMLLSLEKELISFIKDGVTCKSVYQHALAYIHDKMPDLEKNFVKNVGFGTGTEFRDSAYLLSAKNTRTLKTSMILNISIGFNDLVDKDGNKYALHISDTVRIEETKSTLITEGMKTVKDQLFFLTAESDEEKPKKSAKPSTSRANGSPAKKMVAGKILRNQTRAAKDEAHQSAAVKMMEHQRELHSKLQETGLEKYSEEGNTAGGKEGKGWKKFQSYKGEAALPSEVERLRILVDRKAQTVILPIHGFAVPFHVSTIKNASKTDEGEFTYLRINFQTPGQLAGKKEDTPFEDPDATFVRSISYRSLDNHRFDNVHKQITELKKEANKREQQRKEMADVVEQDSLVELKGRRPHKLSEVFVRPALDGKRLPGEIEIHSNGIRYQSPLGSQKIDVLFSNIKHLFYQPCDHELIVVIHIHLKAPIMIGKKKSSDVQFFREASDVQFDETGNRKRKHRYGDEDEIEMEQQERKRRQMLNKEFRAFAEKIAEAASTSLGDSLELDIPFRELSFEGVPFRTSVRMQPTTECLVHLTDPPFLVITLSDIEIASLERVQYGLKHFDLCFVFKDFTRSPLHVNSIASSQLDDVKNWLDSVDIAMSQSPVNLNWPPIMKTVNESPYDFFQQGGWSFLGGAGEDSENSDESDSESEFEANSDDLDDDIDSSEAGSDFSNVSGSDASGSDFGDDSGDEGDDWDELEKKAAKSDKKKTEGTRRRDTDASDSSDSDNRRSKKKAPTKAPAKANGKSKR